MDIEYILSLQYDEYWIYSLSATWPNTNIDIEYIHNQKIEYSNIWYSVFNIPIFENIRVTLGGTPDR